MTAPTIHPCPFCGYDDVSITEVEPGRIAIDCDNCQCIGPFADTVEEASALWNKPTDYRRQIELHDSLVTEQCIGLERRIEDMRKTTA